MEEETNNTTNNKKNDFRYKTDKLQTVEEATDEG